MCLAQSTTLLRRTSTDASERPYEPGSEASLSTRLGLRQVLCTGHALRAGGRNLQGTAHDGNVQAPERLRCCWTVFVCRQVRMQGFKVASLPSNMTISGDSMKWFINCNQDFVRSAFPQSMSMTQSSLSQHGKPL